MSVKGEFARIVGEAVACLRVVGSPAADTLAADLDRARQAASHDLSGAAKKVIELWDAAEIATLATNPEARTRLEDAAERSRALSRMILGL